MNECKKCNGSGKLDIRNVKTVCDECDGSGFDTSYKDGIICPYCGYKEPKSEYYIDGETEYFDLECGECDKTFTVHITQIYEFTTWREEEE